MRAYLDASVLVALLAEEPLTQRAEAFLRTHSPALIISDFAAAEFASAIARRVRMKAITANDARSVFSAFDTWTAQETEGAQITSGDVASAAVFVRRLDVALRVPDAIHIAIAQRIGADLLTFDVQMAAGARALGTTVLAG